MPRRAECRLSAVAASAPRSQPSIAGRRRPARTNNSVKLFLGRKSDSDATRKRIATRTSESVNAELRPKVAGSRTSAPRACRSTSWFRSRTWRAPTLLFQGKGADLPTGSPGTPAQVAGSVARRPQDTQGYSGGRDRLGRTQWNTLPVNTRARNEEEPLVPLTTPNRWGRIGDVFGGNKVPKRASKCVQMNN